MARPSNHYVSNADLASDIWSSKLSYCEFFDGTRPADFQYHCDAKGKIISFPFDVAVDDLSEVAEPGRIVLLRTDDHVPRRDYETEGHNRPGKRGHLTRVPFVPFKLYRSHLTPSGDLAFTEVVRSFSHGGEFALRGKVSQALTLKLMRIVKGVGQRGNWRGYSYRDEMEAEAITHLYRVALMFNEAVLMGAKGRRKDANGNVKQVNPLAYYTQTITHSFIKVQNAEKEQQAIRDDLLEISGYRASSTRQALNDG